MGRSAHELEKRNLPEIIASLKAKGDLVGLQKLYCIFDAIRDAAQDCDIALVNQLTKQLDDAITGRRR